MEPDAEGEAGGAGGFEEHGEHLTVLLGRERGRVGLGEEEEGPARGRGRSGRGIAVQAGCADDVKRGGRGAGAEEGRAEGFAPEKVFG